MAGSANKSATDLAAGGWTGWLLSRVLGRVMDRALGRLRGQPRREPRLALVERIALAPRQSLALVEAEGRRILVATSADGASAFYPLDKWPDNTLNNTLDNPLERPPLAGRALSERGSRVAPRVSGRVAARVSPRVSW